MSNYSSPIFGFENGGGWEGAGLVLVPAALAHGAWFARPARVFHLRTDSRVHG